MTKKRIMCDRIKKNVEDAAIVMWTEHTLLRDKRAESAKTLDLLKRCAEESLISTSHNQHKVMKMTTTVILMWKKK